MSRKMMLLSFPFFLLLCGTMPAMATRGTISDVKNLIVYDDGATRDPEKIKFFLEDPRFDVNGFPEGSGYAVAIIGGGIYSGHECLSGKVSVALDFTTSSSGTTSTSYDQDTTTVASIIAGDSATYQGLAPGATLVDLRVDSDASNTDYWDDVANALARRSSPRLLRSTPTKPRAQFYASPAEIKGSFLSPTKMRK